MEIVLEINKEKEVKLSYKNEIQIKTRYVQISVVMCVANKEDLVMNDIAMMNELIENTDLIQNIGTKQHNLLEIVRLENKLKEKINLDPFDIEAIEELLLKKYDLKY